MATPDPARIRAYRSGLWAEALAALWLLLHGYAVLAWRYRTPVGEIDLVVRRRGVLAFVEVKKRVAEADALAAVSPENAARVRRAAQWWLKTRPVLADKCDIRFDVMALSAYSRIRHIPNAF